MVDSNEGALLNEVFFVLQEAVFLDRLLLNDFIDVVYEQGFEDWHVEELARDVDVLDVVHIYSRSSLEHGLLVYIDFTKVLRCY